MKKVAIKAFTSMVALVVLFSGLSGTMQVFTKEFSVRASALALVYGDVNDDGKINAVDLTLVKRKISSPGFSGLNLASADVTGDGTVNYYDAKEIQQYILCQRYSFTVSTCSSIISPDSEIVTTNQSTETSLTAEMAAKADALSSAINIYNYLYNNMHSEFYFGSRKGAIGAYEQGGGNDADLSSLLIAMLRYRGYNANYVTSIAGFTEEQLLKWTNTNSIDVALAIAACQGREQIDYTNDGTTYYFLSDYKYVQLEDAGKTYYLDICYKAYEDQPDLYDALDSQYKLSSAESILADGNTDALMAEISKSEAVSEKLNGKSYALSSKKIVSEQITAYPVGNSINGHPHVHDIDPVVSESLSDAESDLVQFQIGNKRSSVYRSADLYKKNVTVSYEVSAASEEYAEIMMGIDASSIFSLPSNEFGQVFSVTPVLKIDATPVFKGSDLDIGDNQSLKIITKSGGKEQTKEANLTAGELCSIVFDMGQISPNELAESYNITLNTTGTLNQNNGYSKNMSVDNLDDKNVYTTEYLGNLLRFTGVMYFSQLDISTRALAERNAVHCENVLRFGIVGFRPAVYAGQIQTQNSKDGIQKDGQYFIDVLSDATQNFSKNNDSAKLRAFGISRGWISSELESAIMEEILNVDGISTTEIFRYANENNIGIENLSASSSKKISDLAIDSDDAAKIQAEIAAGNTVLMTESKVTIDQWSGIGYIVSTPDGLSQTYYISGGYSGGTPSSSVSVAAIVNVTIDFLWIAGSVAAIMALLGPGAAITVGFAFAFIINCIFIELMAFDILNTIEDNYNYYIFNDQAAGDRVKVHAVINAITFGVAKGVGAISSHVATTRIAEKYGEAVVEGIREYGFTSSEIASRVRYFERVGLSESAIQTLMSDAKCMFLGDDILSFLGKQGGNQRLLAELVIGNGDDFTRALLNTNYLDDFCNIIWKSGNGYASVFGTYADDSIACVEKYGDDAIAAINKYGDDAINAFNLYGDDAANGFKNGLTPDEIAQAQTFVQSKPSSAKLGKNIIAAGRTKPSYACAAHHIVAGSSPNAADARAILQKYSIDINCAENGIFLSTDKSISIGTYHCSMHTTVYYREVNNLMSGVQSREEALEMLNYIRECLEQGTFPT